MIKIKEFENKIRKIAGEIGAVAPAKDGSYYPVKDKGELNSFLPLCAQPFKEFLMPKSVALFTFKAQGAKWQFGEGDSAEELTVLYVKPCELKALTFMDKVFGEPYSDTYYQQRRQKLNVIGVSCQEEQKGCFCGSFGISKNNSQESDIFLEKKDDSFLVTANTEKGQKLAEKLGLDISQKSRHCEATTNSVEVISDSCEIATVASLPRNDNNGHVNTLNSKDESPTLDFDLPTKEDLDKALIKLFDENVKLWDDLSHSCLSCGVCTYGCSYCYCFDLAHERDAQVKVWDSCQFPNFTQAAGDHNPRKKIAARLRQRILHKFNYLPTNIDQYGCSGCGRCVRQCPMGIDLRRILSSLNKELLKN